jgi:AhpD family alkylhydroperoxidase
MSFIETPATRRYPWYVRILFALQRRHYGRVLEPARLWGRTPRAFFTMALMYSALDRKSSPIEPALRSLLQVRISQINGCSFCVDLNAATGLKRGATAEQFAALAQFETAPVFSARENAALAFAEAVTRSDRRPDAALIARLRAHFDDDAIVELAALIAYQNMSSKFNAALGVPAQGFCRVPILEEKLWQPIPSAE